VSLEGKIAIVTGAGRGLGVGIAQVLAERGASVMLTGRTQETLEVTLKSIQATGGRAEMVVGDVGVRADVERVVQRTLECFGGIDVLVNNAQSLAFDVPVLELTDDSLDIAFRSGLLGSLYLMQACHPHIKARGGGSVVNFGSSVAIDGTPGFSGYAIAKEGIRGLSRTAAREWGPDNVRVNVICPAGLTEGAKTWLEEHPDVFKDQESRIPLGRVGDPVLDIGRAIAALVSDDLSYLTGATLKLDGGALVAP
jgi:NAD(P)-dependent dehydrogenase (short-subunit alcohol dehydrogenase family)